MCMSFEATNSQNCVQAEAKCNLQNRSWGSLMTMFALSSVIKREINSVYLETGDLYSEVFDSNSIAVIDGFYAIPSIMAVKPKWKKQLKDFITKFRDDMPDYEIVDAKINLWGNFWLNNKSESLPSTVKDTLQKMLITLYPNIYKVLHLVAVLPVVTCTCERSISTLRSRVKNYLRNSMSQDRFIGLVLLHIHKYMEIIDINEIIDRFTAKHPRRLQMVNLLEDD